MALPSSGALSLQDIEDEFGGTGSISISEYYGADTGVPASGTIAISDFYGTSAGFEPVAFGYWIGGSAPSGNDQPDTVRRIQYSNDTVSIRPATLPSGTGAGVGLQDTTNCFIVEGYNGPNPPGSPPTPTGGDIMKFQFSNETMSNPPATFEGPPPSFFNPLATNRAEGAFGLSSKDNGYRTGGSPGSSNIYNDELSKIVFSTETTSISSSNLLPIPRDFGSSLGTVSTGFLVGGEPPPPSDSAPSNPGITKFTYSNETYSNISGLPAIGRMRRICSEFVDRENDFGYVLGGRKVGVPFPTQRSFDIEKINLTNDTQSDIGTFGPNPPSQQFTSTIGGNGNFSPSAGYQWDLASIPYGQIHKFPFANETFNATSPPTPVIRATPGISPFGPITPTPPPVPQQGGSYAIPTQV